MAVGCRTQERGRAIHAMCTRVDRSNDMARPREYPGSSVELGSGLGLSGQPKLVYLLHGMGGWARRDRPENTIPLLTNGTLDDAQINSRVNS